MKYSATWTSENRKRIVDVIEKVAVMDSQIACDERSHLCLRRRETRS